MKACVLSLFVICSMNAYAGVGEQTLSVGYIKGSSNGLKSTVNASKSITTQQTQSVANIIGMPSEVKSDGYSDPQGMFIRYRYEITDEIGVIGSLAYAAYDGSTSGRVNDDAIKWSYDDKYDVTGDYVSALIGPSWRINEYISIYGMAGVAWKHIKADQKQTVRQNKATISEYKDSLSQSKTNAAYSIGTQINIYKNLTFDAAYEGSSGGGDWNVNGFTIGVGYKF